MARYILISSGTGYIMGDTADFAVGRQSDLSCPEEAARLLDKSLGAAAASYSTIAVRSMVPDGADGYYVYRSDIGGADQMPTIIDGTDQEMVEAVERDCEFVGFVERRAHAEKIGLEAEQ